MRPSAVLSSLALASGVSAQNYLGFNSGSTLADRSAKFKADFLAEFKTAQGLVGAPGLFNAVRLYTNIQAYSQDDPIEAFEAAIETKTSILLGVWASGTDNISKELSALNKAVTKFGKDFTDLVIGISIGSEDLYRVSATGIANKAGVGNSPQAIVGFIGDFKKAFAGGPLANIPIGHVDTWDVWGNATNKPVLDAIDFIGVDEYPYYENGKGNEIENAGVLFDRAYRAVEGVANGKPIWVTETGWPTTGEAWDKAVPSVQNAKTYWDEVGCRKLFNKTPVFWYNLRDSNPDNTMKFAITKDLSTTPFFNLTCPTTFKTPDNIDQASPSGATPSPSSTGSSGGSKPSGTSGVNAPANSAASSTTPSSTPNAASSLSTLSFVAYGALAVAGLFALA